MTKNRPIYARLTDAEFRALDARCEKERMTRSALAGRYIAEGLKRANELSHTNDDHPRP